jgi:tRNA pseudouridine38-40 synthase
MEYEGTRFFGWQVQPDQRTVQDELESALGQFLDKETSVIGAGRTDTGVHALGQVANFNTEKTYDNLAIKNALNARLPDDVYIRSAEEVPESFHARFDASGRIYTYRLATSFSVFESRFAWFCEYELDIPRMNDACELLIGKVECTSFAIAKSQKENMSMNIKRCHFTTHKSRISFEIEADRFLHKSVRTMVGTLLLVGRGKMDIGGFRSVIESKDRMNAGETAPAHGLYLTKVKYENSDTQS